MLDGWAMELLITQSYNHGRLVEGIFYQASEVTGPRHKTHDHYDAFCFTSATKGQ